MPLKMLHGDLLLAEQEQPKLSETIFTNIKTKDDRKVHYYTVKGIGPDVKYVKVGDTVGLLWTDATFPFEFEGETLLVSDEEKVMFILQK